MNTRPDPDQLLKRLKAGEEASLRGRLKLFFGASPGVGKTYAMLESARQRKKEGVDVVAGIVETHGRVETAALLDSLEILPRKLVDYRGVKIQELDLDAAVKRHPQLLLVDELAHSNAPGSRHARRWQDVEELLDLGIDVYTTLNVQHWETLNDVVAQITGVTVRETVPDTFLKTAHEVEMVDLPPEELIKRMNDGKVYMGEMAGRAVENFFKPGNLIALRELALRHAAEQVDAQMREFKEERDIRKVWQVGDRLLVGVSPSPMSARLVRATARMATKLHAEWIAANVETPAYMKLSPEDKARVAETLKLAQELGAHTVTLSGNNVTDELLAYAQTRNVTKIVLGKPARPKWREWIQGSIVNDLARRAHEIDLYIISATGESEGPRTRRRVERPSLGKEMAVAGLIVAVETVLCYLFARHVDRTNLAMIYMLGLVWIAYRLGRRPALLASLLSVLCFDFFFVPPYFSFAVTDTEFIFTFLVMLAVGFVISTLTGRLKAQTTALRQRGLETETLYALSRALSETPDPENLVRIAQGYLKEFYQAEILIVLPKNDGSVKIVAGDAGAFKFDERETGTARWVYDHAEAAGSGTDTLAGSSGLYIPLRGSQSTVGVLGIKADWTGSLTPENQKLIEAFASEIGGALESTRLTEMAGRAEAEVETERLRNLILHTFSIDLKEPLERIVEKTSAILGSRELSGKNGFENLKDIENEVWRLKKISDELPQLLADLGHNPRPKN